MQLVFKSKHISIEPFQSIDLPDFTVLTGVNGSGKSHLLDAIEKRKVVLQGLENGSIVLFNYETFRLENEGAFNGQQIAQEREQAWAFHEQQVKRQAQAWKSDLGANYQQMKAQCAEEKKSLWLLAFGAAASYRVKVKNFFRSNNLKGNAQAQGIYSLAKKIPYSLDEVERDDFISLYKPYAFKNNFLPNQLGKIFWDYYIKYRSNQINHFENEKNEKNYTVLTEGEFVLAHGEKPWDLVNKILATFDSLKYEVNSPEGEDYFGNFQLKLKHFEKPGLEVDFSNLSSGERILMALVASVYKSSSDGSFPDVLLLDEVDASLHPSMIKNMLEVIRTIFLKQGVKVILVSHSPTTIAQAPEESIYVMNRSGLQRVVKKSKSEALSVLTEGFATLDQGLKLFDQVSESKLTILTEGNNAALINHALNLHGVSGVEVVRGIEGSSGKNQLKTIFEFFQKIPHDNSVLVVWDCDVNYSLSQLNNTYPYTIPQNPGNSIARRGIENAFPSSLFEDYKKTITLSDGKVLVEFDSARKSDFEGFVISRNEKEDFEHLSGLMAEIA